MLVRTRVKICCISSVDEAELAISAGAYAIGLVGHMPSGPGIIADDLIREIATTVPASIATFLLTSRDTGPDIIDHVKYCRTNTLQVVRHIDPQEYEIIARELPEVKRVQVLHVEGHEVSELINGYEQYVDAFLLDSGRPKASTAKLGGTGRTHDWEISRNIVELTSKPVFLAGGLNPENVTEAINQVRPYGLDICSGLRTDNLLDKDKLHSFMQLVH